MLSRGTIYVWRIALDGLGDAGLAPATPGELARAARFLHPELGVRYLRAHRALRTILGELTAAPLQFALSKNGKPYLPGAPELRFSFSRSKDMALVAAALDIEVGADIERIRPLPDAAAIAGRFLPPSEAAEFENTPEPERERDFFRRWTRFEAMLKARGVGLYGAGMEPAGEWTVREIDAGPNYAAAVAAPQTGLQTLATEFVPARR